MTADKQKKLETLAKKMNRQNDRRLPIHINLLYCFDLVMTPEEIDYLLKWEKDPISYNDAYLLSNMNEDLFEDFFKGILEKCFVLIENDKYILNSIMPGWFEMYLSNGQRTGKQREFSRLLEKYLLSFGKYNKFPTRNLLNYQIRKKSKPFKTILSTTSVDNKNRKIIEVNETFDIPETKIYPAKSVYELIERHGNDNAIALGHCFCREWHSMLDQPCKFNMPSEVCIAFGEHARHVVENGIARYISKKEALALIEECEKKGAIHSVFHRKENVTLSEFAICNCCWDCCTGLGSYNRGIEFLHYKAYYYASIPDKKKCKNCGICVKFCPTNAITKTKKNIKINVDKCIGCGQCTTQCPTEAVILISQERQVILPLQKKSKSRLS